MTTTGNWRPFQGFDAGGLSGARLQAHFAAQWLARAARANIAAQSDDSHSNFGWDDTFDGLATHPLRDQLRLGLRLRDMTIALVDERSSPVAGQSLEGLTDPEVGDRLSALLAPFDLKLEALSAPLAYAMPDHPLAHGAAYRAREFADGLVELSSWFANGRLSLEGLGRTYTSRGFPVPSVRCWPHHFDLGTMTVFPIPEDGGTAYIGAGLSPGDGYYDEPYFYVSIYPRPKTSELPALAAGGRQRRLGRLHS